MQVRGSFLQHANSSTGILDITRSRSSSIHREICKFRRRNSRSRPPTRTQLTRPRRSAPHCESLTWTDDETHGPYAGRNAVISEPARTARISCHRLAVGRHTAKRDGKREDATAEVIVNQGGQNGLPPPAHLQLYRSPSPIPTMISTRPGRMYDGSSSRRNSGVRLVVSRRTMWGYMPRPISSNIRFQSVLV